MSAPGLSAKTSQLSQENCAKPHAMPCHAMPCHGDADRFFRVEPGVLRSAARLLGRVLFLALALCLLAIVWIEMAFA